MTARLEEAKRLLRLARRDHAAFEALAGLAQPELFAAACFHAQQAVEKALKAAISLYGVEFRRTHDLEELAGQLADAGVALPQACDMLPRLTPYAVQLRYSEEALNLISIQQARILVVVVLQWVDTQVAE